MSNSIVFHLTNSFPRKFFGRIFYRISQIESKYLTSSLIYLTQRLWGNIDLSESEKKEFNTFHEFFTRKLKSGSRDFLLNSTDILVSPCDAILGEFGDINEETMIQAKSHEYSMKEFLGNDPHYFESLLEGSKFVTLRIKPTFYHRAHAPIEAFLQNIKFIPGDLWNVDESTVSRVPNLFVKNERLLLKLSAKHSNFVLAFVGSVLVGSIHCNITDKTYTSLSVSEDASFDDPVKIGKGDEIGMFHYGSTIILVLDENYEILLSDNQRGNFIKAGTPLCKLTEKQ